MTEQTNVQGPQVDLEAINAGLKVLAETLGVDLASLTSVIVKSNSKAAQDVERKRRLAEAQAAIEAQASKRADLASRMLGAARQAGITVEALREAKCQYISLRVDKDMLVANPVAENTPMARRASKRAGEQGLVGEKSAARPLAAWHKALSDEDRSIVDSYAEKRKAAGDKYALWRAQNRFFPKEGWAEGQVAVLGRKAD